MPTFEYRCENCEEIEEHLVLRGESPPQNCYLCGGKLKKIVSRNVGLQFKGSGFYITDYKKAKPETEEKVESKEHKSVKPEKETTSLPKV